MYILLFYIVDIQNAKRRRTEVDVLFPKQLVDLRLDKDKEKMVITPLTSFSDLLAHVDQMQVHV